MTSTETPSNRSGWKTTLQSSSNGSHCYGPGYGKFPKIIWFGCPPSGKRLQNYGNSWVNQRTTVCHFQQQTVSLPEGESLFNIQSGTAEVEAPGAVLTSAQEFAVDIR